jgi:hypothetical protein
MKPAAPTETVAPTEPAAPREAAAPTTVVAAGTGGQPSRRKRQASQYSGYYFNYPDGGSAGLFDYLTNYSGNNNNSTK